MKKSFILLSVFLSALLSLGMSKPVDEAQTSTTHKTDKERSKYQHPSGTTKPHAGIELDYPAPKALQAGETITLPLNFLTRAQAESLEISISSDAGLQLNSATQYQFVTAKGEKHTISLAFSALQDGRYFIDVMANIIHNGQSQGRAFSIPVTVGDVTKLKSRSEMLSPAGYKSQPEQGVISMPAVETTE